MPTARALSALSPMAWTWAPKRRVAVEEVTDEDDGERPEEQRRDAEEVSGAEDVVERIVGDRHRLEVGQPAHSAGEKAHRRERHEE